jgi:hypothetical protein
VLYQLHLDATDWSDGALDGTDFSRIVHLSPTTVVCTGLLFVGVGSSWLEPFHAVFELSTDDDHLTAYTLCFRTHHERGRPIPFGRSDAWISRHVWIPDPFDPTDETLWKYVFRGPPPDPSAGG